MKLCGSEKIVEFLPSPSSMRGASFSASPMMVFQSSGESFITAPQRMQRITGTMALMAACSPHCVQVVDASMAMPIIRDSFNGMSRG
ncbi:MAG TPA: hypothetical protein PLI62_13020 [Spirochaetota bacterium]|nr:hypothetical protein [Spirochaetota bacterium]